MNSSQDKHILESFQATVQQKTSLIQNSTFGGYPWDGEDDEMFTMNVIIDSCISLHLNPILESVTADAQQYNIKQNLTTRNF